MSLLSRLIKKIFGDNQPKPEPVIQPVTAYTGHWEKERQERIKVAEEQLKDWMVTTLTTKGSLPFSWESGSDEAFVTFQDKTDEEERIFEDLEEYIIDKLNIPDAGEFQMNGSGTIYMADRSVKANYHSVMKGIIDFDEETEEEVYSEEEHDSADLLLFSI